MPHKLPFRIVYASSQDNDFPAAELNYHAPTTKGWASCRFCTFPQRLIFELEENCKITKIQILCHQSLIPTKVDFYIGGIVEGDRKRYEDADYILLGYVSLSDNKNTEFKARELKSVHVDTYGSFIQLVLHDNYQNAHNQYNQVSLIAVNMIGEDSRSSTTMERGLPVLRLDAVPPTEDLAFDIYQDPEVARIIRQLEKQKLIAVTEERFDDAQKIRDATKYLQRVGERLGRLTLEKQQAVAEENYERAKLKKFQINEVRSNLHRDLDLVQMLDEGLPDGKTWNGLKDIDVTTGSVIDNGVAYGSNEKSTSKSKHDEEKSKSATFTNPDDRALPTLKRPTRSGRSEARQAAKDSNSNALIASTEQEGRRLDTGREQARDVSDALLATDVVVFQRNELIPLDRSHHLPYDHHLQNDCSPPGAPLHPAHCHLANVEGDFLSKPDSPPLPIRESMDPPVMMEHPEPLSEANKRLAGVAIDVVGIDVVTKALSKSWAFRESALLELQKRAIHPELMPSASSPRVDAVVDPRTELRSTTFLVKRALNDQVLSIFRLGTDLIRCAVVDFAERHGLSRADLFYAVDSLIPILFSRTGDTSQRMRDAAKAQILSMAQWPQLRHCSSLWSEFTRPFSSVALDRLALSRVELATELYSTRGVDSTSNNDQQHGFTLEALAAFTAQALTHRLSEIREAAENLMVALYRAENRSVVRLVLPVDDIFARRNPLYRRIFTKFDRIDGLNIPGDAKTKTPSTIPPPSSDKKQDNLNILHAEVDRLRSMVTSNGDGVTHCTQSPSAGMPRKASVQPRGVLPCNRHRQSAVAQRLSAAKKPVPARKAGRRAPSRSLAVRDDSKAVGSGGQYRVSPLAKSPRGAQPTEQLDKSGSGTGEAELLLSLDRTCIFCGEHNDKFNEEYLDLHYWKDCPMLYRCTQCKQVVEIASMTDHLLEECEAAPPGRYRRCSRCFEAVISDQLSGGHSCLPSTCPNADTCLRCPLCHQGIPTVDTEGSPLATSGGLEELWKAHLLGTGTVPGVPFCTENPRQFQPMTQLEATVKRTTGAAGKPSPRLFGEKAPQTRSFIPRPTYQPSVRPV